ncbi:MAG: alpha/beta fold hydrolase [Sedimentisphaerales bacterium]|nr:alpha/beta fold hydrolase [Sedimentisphaerales bacterium]
MNKRCKMQIPAALILIVTLSNISFAAEPDIGGIWMGTVKIPGGEVRVVFKISKDKNGSLSATMDSPDQGAANIPVSKVSFENNKLLLDVQLIRGSFEGTLKPDGTFDGQLKQSGISMPLVLKRTDEAPKASRPQEPKKPYPYIEEEITIRNPEANIKLAGTLTIPRSEKPCPAVILISGSGAEDRDETIFGHKPFWVLADYLTRKGIAVLRVDDRGVGGSTGNTADSTSEDFAGDIISEVNFLKSRKEIDPAKIGLAGHSEGGIIAPIAAVKSPDVAFIVLLAGTGVTGEEILYLQNKLILKNAGASDEALAKQLEFLNKQFDVIKNESDEKILEKKTREILTNQIGNNKELIEKTLNEVTSPWFRFFLIYDPKPVLTKVKCPVLALNGSLDLQVAPKENLSAIEEALKEGGNKNYNIKEFPGLNHLFQKAKTGAVSEYSQIEESISQDVLDVVAKWILEQVGKK